MSTGPRIVLIHATPVAIEPILQAFKELWPEAEPVSVLDDSLSVDRAKTSDITPAINQRIIALAEYGYSLGAKAILFTCSAFGPAIEAAGRAVPVPVLKPNEAMFEEALGQGEKLGMVATFGPSIATMEAEFAEEARRLRPGARLATRLATEAMAALRAGDAETHNALVAREAKAFGPVDALMLAHFSTARALRACREATSVPVLSSPEAAVRKVRKMVGGVSAEQRPKREEHR
ncbi:Asp/Glu/hydantoin racemase [Bosea sp. BE125]|uniref:aspartate/glutamate racemase family protein n=1 Tax=Bosea sp. BE125 TaxID=2817909 RepID=UPI00285450C7|nr:aspartate/glutamate racemase family protein [Bosea sp. BE125]MDR6869361.1 Asp/Glu/hydantoin racemase [Bosea sp. BE125]